MRLPVRIRRAGSRRARTPRAPVHDPDVSPDSPAAARDVTAISARPSGKSGPRSFQSRRPCPLAPRRRRAISLTPPCPRRSSPDPAARCARASIQSINSAKNRFKDMQAGANLLDVRAGPAPRARSNHAAAPRDLTRKGTARRDAPTGANLLDVRAGPAPRAWSNHAAAPRDLTRRETTRRDALTCRRIYGMSHIRHNQ